MKNKRRNHTTQFKAKVALEAAKGDKTIAELASRMDELGLLLRGATFLRDGSLNLFRTGLTKMFERKGITNGQTDWPSIQPIP